MRLLFVYVYPIKIKSIHPFELQCKQFAEHKLPFYVCPGTSSWNTLIGRTQNAIGNLKSAAKYGSENGAEGYLITGS